VEEEKEGGEVAADFSEDRGGEGDIERGVEVGPEEED
jgi:hypothetical protein